VLLMQSKTDSVLTPRTDNFIGHGVVHRVVLVNVPVDLQNFVPVDVPNIVPLDVPNIVPLDVPNIVPLDVPNIVPRVLYGHMTW
jgi:hypothetical protein